MSGVRHVKYDHFRDKHCQRHYLLLYRNCSMQTINNVNCADCPAGFTNISSVNGCYKVVTHNLEWSVAGLQCRSLHKDAHLLVINDAQEQSAVATMFASVDRQCIHFLLFFTVLLRPPNMQCFHFGWLVC